jgi:hypothetical protein
LVYAVEKTDDGKFKTVDTEQNNVARFEAKGKIENYGTPKEEGDEGIADEYDARYCFTPTILGVNEPMSASMPASMPEPGQEGGGPGSIKRYAMFAWKTRYVVTDAQVEELKSQAQTGGDPKTGDLPKEMQEVEGEGESPKEIREGEGEGESPKEEQKEPDPDGSPKEEGEVEGESPKEEGDGEGEGDEKETPKETLKEEDQDLEKPEELKKPEESKKPVQPHGESALKLDLDEEPSEKEKDQMALERLKFPTIYTITKNESTDNKPVVMWGVLNSKQFAGL